MNKLNARDLRTTENPDPERIKNLNKNPIYIVLDNVLDTYNVGAIFRLADATAATKIYLCGQTETPPNSRIKKASVNTWQWVEWEYVPTAVEAISKIKKDVNNIKIVAIEQNAKSIKLSEYKPNFPVCLIVGNESYGVSKEAIAMSDEIVELPMYGINNSLNVMVCLGIVLYKLIENLSREVNR